MKPSQLLLLLGLLAVPLEHTLGDVTFTRVTSGDIGKTAGSSLGCAWGDYDGDGYLDLFVANDQGGNFLYHNNRDGTFTRITTGGIVRDAGQWRGCAWADFDNDGHLDLVAARVDEGVSQLVLYRNNGDGTFTRLPANAAGGVVLSGGGNAFGPVWGDYNHDGRLDLFVARFGVNWLLENLGDGTFKPVNNFPGIDLGNHASAAWIDCNNDGQPDLFYVTGDNPRVRLYLNQSGGNFVPASANPLLSESISSFGFAWGDYDNDGLPDVFVANNTAGQPRQNGLYHNEGNGLFTRITGPMAGSMANDGAGFDQCAWADYDNDGYLDLFVTSTVGLAGANPGGNLLYHNNGDGTFTRIRTGAPVEDLGAAVGCAWGDIDNDGFLDLFVARGGVVRPENSVLYHNGGNSNGWLMIRCVGTSSNRSAIGAKVRVLATLGGKTFWQMREISGGTGLQQNALDAHFGLGDAPTADTVRIEWPSGTVQELHAVAAKQLLTVTEPPKVALTVQNGAGQLLLQGAPNNTYEIQKSLDFKSWVTLAQALTPPTNESVRVTDSMPASSFAFYRAVSPPPTAHDISVVPGEILFELVGEGFSLTPPSSAQVGYFTYVKGIDAVFGGVPEDASTAAFTFYRDTVDTGVTANGPIKIVSRKGTTTIYLQSQPGADAANPDTFRKGLPVQVSTFRQQAIIDTTTQTFSIVDEDTITTSQVFSFNGVASRIGKAGDVYRTMRSGHLNTPGSSPVGWLAGYSVGADASESN